MIVGVFVSLPCFIVVSRESFQQISLLSMIFAINFFVDKLFSDKRNSLFLMYWVLVYITILNECWILKCFFIFNFLQFAFAMSRCSVLFSTFILLGILWASCLCGLVSDINMGIVSQSLSHQIFLLFLFLFLLLWYFENIYVILL